MTERSPWTRPEPGEPPAEPGQGQAPAPPGGESPAGPEFAALPDAETVPELPAPAAMETLPEPPPEQPGTWRGAGPSSAALLPIVGMMLLIIGAVVVALIAYVDNRGGSSDPANRGDGDYDLVAMGLRNRDMPPGLELVQRLQFDNEEWAQIVGQDDPDAKKAQLDAQKRIRNEIGYFSYANSSLSEHLGTTLSITSQSTLYETVDAARADTNRLCGLLIDEKGPLEEFAVPKIGDQSVGFTVITEQQGIGKAHDTVVCFRTGRIVHGIVQSGLDGTQNVGLVVRLAQRMLEHVKNAFNATPDPVDEEPAG